MSRDSEMFRLLVEYGDLAVKADAHRTKHSKAIDEYLTLVDRMNEIRKLFDAHEKYRLSPRELDVLQAISEGLTYEEMGARLYISPETVRTHIRKAMDKIGVRSRAAAVAIATKHGLVDPEPEQKQRHVETIQTVAEHARRKPTAVERVLKAV